MFFSHLAEIEIERDEPDIDPIKESKIILRRNALLAEKIVARNLLKPRKKNPKVSEKIRALLEFDQRLDSARVFVETWNYWRDFYFDVGPMSPKNKGQLTCIEKIIEMSQENNINLSILIGATHKAYVWRKIRPGFSEALSKGLEHYENLYDDVVSDLDKQEYEMGALR